MKISGIRLAAIAAAGLLVSTTIPAMATGKVCDARTYGAKADGTTKDTKAIQSAIDDCANADGGTVQLSGGTFLSGPIVLKSNVTLDLAKGSTLMGSPDHADYPVKTEFRAPGTQSLVSATNAQNVAITGGGSIDGNGESWWAEARSHRGSGIVGKVTFRPRLVVFDHCKHVRIEGVTIQNSPSWQVVPYYTDDMTIRKRELPPYDQSHDAGRHQKQKCCHNVHQTQAFVIYRGDPFVKAFGEGEFGRADPWTFQWIIRRRHSRSLSYFNECK